MMSPLERDVLLENSRQYRALRMLLDAPEAYQSAVQVLLGPALHVGVGQWEATSTPARYEQTECEFRVYVAVQPKRAQRREQRPIDHPSSTSNVCRSWSHAHN